MAESGVVGAETIRSSQIAFALAALRRYGMDPAALEPELAHLVSAAPVVAGEHDAMVDLAEFVGLLERSAVATGDEHFGLHLGAGTGRQMLGDLGYSFEYAPTVGAALRNLARFAGLVTGGVEIELVEHGRGLARLSYRILSPSIWPRRHDAEAAVSLVVSQLRSMLGSTWAPRSIEFEHPAPSSLDPYDAILGTGVAFGCPTNAIVVAGRDLDMPNPGADGRLLEIVERHLDGLAAAVPVADHFVVEVRRAIASRLPNGDAAIDVVAGELAMSERTLQRRLRERGVEFRELLDQTRSGLAVRYLSDEGRPVAQVAFMLGYSEISAFTRAFRRWTGTTPANFARGAAGS